MRQKEYKTPLERYREKRQKKLEKYLGIKQTGSSSHIFKRPSMANQSKGKEK